MPTMVNMTDNAQSLEERCGTSVHATEAILTILQEQNIKQLPGSTAGIFRLHFGGFPFL